MIPSSVGSVRRGVRRASVGLAAAIVVLASLAKGPQAHGADDKTACVASYDRSQMLRHDHRLQRAREELRSCSKAACPSLIRNDCLTWLDQVQAELPSLAIRATKDGADVADVTVVEDDAVVATRLDGSSLEVDPGEHSFRFEVQGTAPVTIHLVVREREKDRVVPVNFVSSAAGAAGSAPAADRPASVSRPVPAGALVLGGVGVAGLVTFGVLGAVGKGQQSSLQNSCAPTCSQHDIDKVRTDYIAADVALGVGAAALVSAGIWFFLRPEQRERSARSDTGIDVAPSRAGAVVGWRGAF